MNNYKLFLRSANNFTEFAKARKIHYCFADTEQEARAICKEYNDNRTKRQIDKGTKLEYTKE